MFLHVFSFSFLDLSTRKSAFLLTFCPVDKMREERHNPDTHGAYYIINSFSIFI